MHQKHQFKRYCKEGTNMTRLLKETPGLRNRATGKWFKKMTINRTSVLKKSVENDRVATVEELMSVMEKFDQKHDKMFRMLAQ
jgi:hypothetical protein